MASDDQRAEEAGGVEEAIDRFVDECRGGALWYVRPGYYPRTDTERVAVLEAIQERCSLEQVAVEEARAIVRLLPAESAGRCVLDERGHLQRSTPDALQRELEADRLRFHEGRIRGAFPEIRDMSPSGPELKSS